MDELRFNRPISTFEEVYTRTLGYNAVMLALDHIDTCNRIRGSRSELAKYWVDVMGESVPANTPQLGVNPSMMITSAMSASLNSSRPDKISYTYYVRAHTYVIKNGKKYVSRWSAVKKVKIR